MVVAVLAVVAAVAAAAVVVVAPVFFLRGMGRARGYNGSVW